MRTRVITTSVACCLVFTACGGGSDSASTTTTTVAEVTTPVVATDPPVEAPATSTTTTVPMVFEGATVIVANGNIVGGSAGRMSDALALAGFTTGTPTNGTEKVDDSVVYYTSAAGAQAVAETLALKLGGVSALAMPDPIPTEDGTLDGGDVLLLLGNNQADKSLDELSGPSAGDGTATTTTGSTIVVANVSGVSGSAGRMSSILAAAGYTVGDPTNGIEALTDSIVYYTSAAGAQAEAEALADTLGGISVLPMPDPIPTEDGTLGGEILLLLGSAQADKTLADFAG